MACFPRPVMMMIWSQPEAMASSTPYWMMGLSTRGSISLGWALVAGRKRVPRPAAGKTALRTFAAGMRFHPGIPGCTVQDELFLDGRFGRSVGPVAQTGARHGIARRLHGDLDWPV